MNDQILQIIIQAKDTASAVMKQVGGAIDNVNKKAGNLASAGLKSMQSGFETTAGILKTGFLVGLGGVATAMGLFIQNTAGMEQTRSGFEGMIGDVAKTDALMKQLVETAKKTPLQFTDVAKNAENLLAFGVASDTINDKVKMLGDIARGNSVKLGLLTNVYGQVKSAGRLMGQDLLQFTSQGIPMIDGLAKHFGVAKEEIKKMVENGEVGFADVDAVLQDLTNSGGIFYKAMEKQSLTLNGVVSNLTDSFFGFGRALMGMDTTGKIEEGGIFWYLAQGGQQLLDKVNQLDGKVIGQSIIDFAKQVQTFINPIINYFREHTDQLNAVLVGLASIGITLVVGAFVTMAVAVASAIWPFVLLGVVVGGLFYLFQTNQDVQNFVNGAWALLVQGFNYAKDVVLPALVDFWNNQLVPAFNYFKDSILPQMIKLWEDLYNVFQTYILPVLNGLWTDFMTKIVPALVKFWEEATKLWKSLWELWQTLAPVLIPILQFLAVVIGVVVVGAIVLIGGLIWGFISILSWLFAKIREGIDWFNGFVRSIQEFWTKASDVFNNLKNINLGQIGEDIVQGLINGLNDKLNDLKNKAKDIANTVQNGIKDALKIKSPSRVMMELGEYTGEGFALGMDKTENLVKSSGQNMAQSSVGGVGAGQSAVATNNTVNNNNKTIKNITQNIYQYNTNTITPAWALNF